MSGLPCNHAVSAIYKARKHPEDYVSDFFKKPMYLNSYRPVFHPVPGQHAWTKTSTEDIMPPGFKEHKRGRKQEKRRKGKYEVPKPKSTSRMATTTCGNCYLQGHKWTSCKVPLKPDLAIRKNNHMANRRLPTEQGQNSQESSVTESSRAASARPSQPPVSAAASAAASAASSSTRAPPGARPPYSRGNARGEFHAPRPSNPAGILAYLSAGRNAGPGRDANSDPLASSSRRNAGPKM